MSQEKIKKGYKTKNKSIIYSYSKEEMQALLDNSSSYVKVLEKIGINPRGGNPKTLKKFIKEFGLNEDKLNENRQKLFSENGKNTSQTFILPLEQVLKKM